MPPADVPASEPTESPWKTAASLLGLVVLVAIVVVGTSVLGSVVAPFIGPMASVLSAALAAALTWGGLWLLLVRWRRHTLDEIGLSGRALLYGLPLGLVTGGGCALAAFGLAVAVGAFELRFDGSPSVAPVIAFVLATAVHAYFEEIAFRSGLVGGALRKVPAWIAVTVPALLFGLGHLGNEGASLVGTVNTVLLGAALGAMFVPARDGRRSIGLPTGWHVGWNLVVPLCGSRVSGNERDLWIHAEARGADLWTGGDYGIEASITTTLVAVLVLGAALARWRHLARAAD